MPDTATDFRDWEGRMALSRVSATAAMLGITRQSAHDLRTGKARPHPSTRRLMAVLLWCKERGELPPIS